MPGALMECQKAPVSTIAGRMGIKRAAVVMLMAAAGVLLLPRHMRAQDAQASPGAPAAGSATPGAQPAGLPAAQVRAVRLSLVEGTVKVTHDGGVQFPQAVINMPILQGYGVETGNDGRAEIEFEDGSVARITPNSTLELTKLSAGSDGTLQTVVDQKAGLVYYELRSDPKTPFQVNFANRTAMPTANSTFRVNLAANPEEVAVFDGEIQVQGASNGYLAEVPQGKSILFKPSGDAKYTIADGIAPSGFDEWNDQLDQEAAKEAANQTPARVQNQGGGSVMDSGFGWSDLDNAGGWYPLPGYGMVWQPYGAGPGFNPYGYGMWANYGGGLGYSWVSGYPWGWLPFHYGMWSYIGGFGWGWMPGAYPFAGFGFGYGGYGYGGYGYGGYGYGYTNVYGGPAGYQAPAPPSIHKGVLPPRTVAVGTAPRVMPGTINRGVATTRGGRVEPGRGAVNGARAISFNGARISPLRATLPAGTHVPVRNAALYNNYPAHAFQGNIRTAMLEHAAAPGRPGAGAVRPGMTGARSVGTIHGGAISRTGGVSGGRLVARGAGDRPGTVALRSALASGGRSSVNLSRGEVLAGRSMGGIGAFGQHTSFTPRGGFGLSSARAGGGSHGGFGGGGFGGRGGFGGGHGGGFGGGHGGGFGGGHGGGGGGGGHGGGGGGR